MSVSGRGVQAATSLLKGCSGFSTAWPTCSRTLCVIRAASEMLPAPSASIARWYSATPADTRSATAGPSKTTIEPPISKAKKTLPRAASTSLSAVGVTQPTSLAGAAANTRPLETKIVKESERDAMKPPLNLPPINHNYDTDDPPLPKKLTYPITPKATHSLFGGIILTRAPLLTRPLTPFEESFFLYQKRLNERLTLPFMDGIYFKPDTPVRLDWDIKIRRRRMVAAKEIGYYKKRGREAWNDEELVGSKLASTKYVYDKLLEDATMLVNDEGEVLKPEDVVPVERPQPRTSEADLRNDTKRLDRKMDRTLYLVVQDRHGVWKFPDAPIAMEEALHQTAARALLEQCGKNMNTWIVGRLPVAHAIIDPPSKADLRNSASSSSISNPASGGGSNVLKSTKGYKIFYMKGRIMAGQADIRSNTLGLRDFQWLTKEELQRALPPGFFGKVRNMMADR